LGEGIEFVARLIAPPFFAFPSVNLIVEIARALTRHF
jgi:hypothetical protein